MRKLSFTRLRAWLVLLTISCAASSRAATLQASVQTSSLIGGSYSLIFDLINGDGAPNNTVTLSSFQFGGGGVVGSPTLTGGATGDLSSAGTLRDTTFFSEILQGFSAGTVLSFQVDTTLAFGGGTPDSVTFFVLDNGTGLPVPTLDPSGADSLMEIDLLPTPVVHAFGSDPSRTPLVIPPPMLGGSGGNAVPEPSAGALIGSGILGCYVLRRRRGRGDTNAQ